MFRVPTYLAPSPIHGIGVFAAVPIRAGRPIWDFDPEVDWRLAPEQLSAFPEPFQAKLRRWCYREPSGAYVLCGDNARFMNHSTRPNCDDSGDRTVANRDIESGEELTCDYRSFDADSAEHGPEFEVAGEALAAS